jgi:hypothetical protein
VSEEENGATLAVPSVETPADMPARSVVGRPFPKGVSGNPRGRPRIEPKVRRYARRYDRRAVAELFKLGSDPKVPADVRRRALTDLIAIGSGRPVLIQETAGKQQPLVSIGINAGAAGLTGRIAPADAARAYRDLVAGLVDPLAIEFVPEDEPSPAAAPGADQEPQP